MRPGDLSARTIQISGDGGDLIDAYLAEPAGDGPYPGIVVIHHFPGWDLQTHEITRTFAVHGYRALCPNLYHRESAELRPQPAGQLAGEPAEEPAGTATQAIGDDLAISAGIMDACVSRLREEGGAPDDRVVGDIAGAVSYLREGPSATGKVGVIGYCSGGRHAVLVGCCVDVDAVIDCYGAAVLTPMPDGAIIHPSPIPHLLANLRSPLLGLFGADDQYPAQPEVAELDRLLTELGKPHEFHTYEKAGHAFFAVNRPIYRPEAATQGWAVIWEWLRATIG